MKRGPGDRLVKPVKPFQNGGGRGGGGGGEASISNASCVSRRRASGGNHGDTGNWAARTFRLKAHTMLISAVLLTI